MMTPTATGPERGALDAVAKCRQRCWEKDWVIDLDVRKFFDSVPWDLMVKAVEANTTHEQRWIVLYVRRWLAAPIVMPDGRLAGTGPRDPAGVGGFSPVLANLFMHYAFDTWLEREFPAVEFERFADDAVVHCATERQAEKSWPRWRQRMAEVGLELHPDKTKIVYCKDRRRRSAVMTRHVVHLPGVHVPGQESARPGTGPACSPAFLPGGQQGRPQEDERASCARWRIHLRTATDLGELARG